MENKWLLQDVDEDEEPLYDSSLFLDETLMNKVKEFSQKRKTSIEIESNRKVKEKTNERDQRTWK